MTAITIPATEKTRLTFVEVIHPFQQPWNCGRGYTLPLRSIFVGEGFSPSLPDP